jgi:transcriptional regulator NrdR family protein
MTDHADIHFFRRGQQCQTCYHRWLSAEVHEDFIYELVKLRNELRDIKKNAEAHSKESEYGSLRLA